MPSIPALRNQRQANLCEFETSLVYSASFRKSRAVQRNPVSKNQRERDNNYYFENDIEKGMVVDS